MRKSKPQAERITDVSWWLQSAPAVRSHAPLRFSPETGYSVEGLSGELGRRLHRIDRKEVLWGMGSNGESFACEEWFVTSWQRAGEKVTVSLFIPRLIKGLKTDSAIPQFVSATFIYANLHGWFQSPGIELDFGEDGASIVRRKRGPCCDFATDDGWQMHHTVTYSQSGPGSFEPTIEFVFRDGLQLLSCVPSSIQDYYEHEEIFRLLVNVLGDCELKTESVSFTANDSSRVKILDSMLECQKEGFDPALYQPVPFPIISMTCGAIFTRWGKVYSDCKTLVSAYLLSRNEAQIPPELSFQLILQALEGLHRMAFGGKFISDDLYKPVKRQITSAIPSDLDEDFSNRLKAAIRYGNEYSLRRRLRQLVGGLTDARIFGFAGSDFIGRSVETRNYLAHRDIESRQIAASGSQLVSMTRNWQIVFLFHFLKFLGMPEKECENACRRIRPRIRFSLHENGMSA